MKLGALHCLICDGCLEVFHWLAKLPVRHYRPPPLLGGYLAQWPPRHSCSRRSYDSDSFPGGLLDKLIWEDAERGISCSPVLMYSFGTSMPKLTGKLFRPSCLFECRGFNSFSHVFENDAVVKPLCPLANLFGGCFCLGSGPFCLSGLLFLLTKRKSGWGICGSSGWFCVLFGLLWFACISRPFWSLYKLTFYCLCSCKDRATVRHRPYSRKKKLEIQLFAWRALRTPYGHLKGWSAAGAALENPVRPS